MNIDIRKANIEDLPKVQELNHELLVLEYESFDPDLNVEVSYEKDSVDYFKNKIDNELVFLAIAKNKIVGCLVGGFCSANYTTAKLAKVDSVLVLEDYRKCGIGSKLINEFKGYCLDKGVDSIGVTVYAKNQSAISYYAKNGFEEWDITLRCKI